MAHASNSSGPDFNRDKIEAYKIGADEFRERYEGMRDLEWKLLLQVYAGYAAIATVYTFLIGGNSPLDCRIHGFLVVLFILVTLFFFILGGVYDLSHTGAFDLLQ
jgi:hypothetical protein